MLARGLSLRPLYRLGAWLFLSWGLPESSSSACLSGGYIKCKTLGTLSLKSEAQISSRGLRRFRYLGSLGRMSQAMVRSALSSS